MEIKTTKNAIYIVMIITKKPTWNGKHNKCNFYDKNYHYNLCYAYDIIIMKICVAMICV